MRIENSFLPVRGVGERTERGLWADGVTHWEDFDGAGVGPTVADRIDRFIDVAGDHLARGESRFFADVFPDGSHWRLYEDFQGAACFLDIETTGLSPERHDVTVVGLHNEDDTRTLVRGQDLDRGRLVRALDEASLLITFNGKRFDVPFLETAFDLSIDLPHLDLMYPCREVGLTGGLKAIEAEVGIGREHEDLSGRDAVRLWHAHERGDDGALETLLKYNRADTRNLRTLADHVTGELHDRVFVAACDEEPPVARSD